MWHMPWYININISIDIGGNCWCITSWMIVTLHGQIRVVSSTQSTQHITYHMIEIISYEYDIPWISCDMDIARHEAMTPRTRNCKIQSIPSTKPHTRYLVNIEYITWYDNILCILNIMWYRFPGIRIMHDMLHWHNWIPSDMMYHMTWYYTLPLCPEIEGKLNLILVWKRSLNFGT